LQQSVIDSQAVIAHAPSNQVKMFLLARQPFENLQQLCRSRIQGVIEFCFVDFTA
jgi:hypothetical protein